MMVEPTAGCNFNYILMEGLNCNCVLKGRHSPITSHIYNHCESIVKSAHTVINSLSK